MLPRVQTLTFNLQAGENKTFGAAANFVYCKSLTAAVDFRFLDTSKNTLSDWISVTAGQGLAIDQAGGSVEFRSTAGGDFVFQTAVGTFIDNSVVIASGTILPTRPAAYGTWSDVAGTAVAAGAATAQANLGADATRLKAVVGNPVGSANEIYVKFAATATPSPVAIQPGGWLEIEGTMAIFVYNPGASSITPICQKMV